MKNRLTLLRSYTSMLWFDCLAWGTCGENWQKLRSVSRKIHNHMKSVYLNKGTKADNLAENERLLNQAKKEFYDHFKNSI